jgi:outer membrane immunogenic protein
MRHALITAIISPLLFAAAPVNAADLGRGSRPPPQAYYAPPPAFTWQGFYIGINAGYGFGAFTNGGSDLFSSANGGLIGLTGGYNFQLAPNIVLGAEADFAFANLRESHTSYFGFTSSGTIDDIMTLRGRAGYTIERAMVYVTGGLAGSNNNIVLNSFFPLFYGGQSKFQTGWAVGGGIEFMFTNSLSAKAEYLFTSVGSDRYFDFSPAALQSGVDTSAIKGGLNYHF